MQQVGKDEFYTPSMEKNITTSPFWTANQRTNPLETWRVPCINMMDDGFGCCGKQTNRAIAFTIAQLVSRST